MAGIAVLRRREWHGSSTVFDQFISMQDRKFGQLWRQNISQFSRRSSMKLLESCIAPRVRKGGLGDYTPHYPSGSAQNYDHIPNAYHEGFSMDFTIAEAVNYADAY